MESEHTSRGDSESVEKGTSIERERENIAAP